METTYKIVEEEKEMLKPVEVDENKRIEVSTMVEQKETFTIAQLKNEIAMFESQIATFQARIDELNKKIADASNELGLEVK